MSSVQVSIDNSVQGFIIFGHALVKNGIIIKDTGRTTVLKKYTVLSQIASSGKYTPFVALNATTGASVPCAIYLGDDIAAADLVSGDVEDLPILIGGGCNVDKNLLVWDAGTQSAASVINTGTIEARTAENALLQIGIAIEDTVALDGLEN
jgi:hypothetical protein